MGIQIEDFKRYKDKYMESLKRYGLCDKEDDLYSL